MDGAMGKWRGDRWGAVTVALVSAASLVLQYVILVRATADTIGPTLATVRFFSYFTILSNLLVTAVAMAAVVQAEGRAGCWLRRARVRGAAALYIGMTGLVYGLILRHLWQPQGLQWWADSGLHYVTPALYLLWWLLTPGHGRLGWRDAVAWLAFPALYATWVAARGAVVQEYPYPFIDVGALGWAKAGGNAGLMLLLFCMASGVLVEIDRRLGARLAPAWRREPARGE